MNRETPLKFGAIPTISHPRSKIDISHGNTLTLDTGEVIPFDVQEILPGDTIQIDMSGVVRMMTPIVPVMDRAFCDVYWMFVPRRLTWDHWEEFNGQNDDEWTQTHDYEIPIVKAPTGGWQIGTIADYMGIPLYIDKLEVDAQYFRSYAKIWSDWFRSENLQKSSHFYKDETTRTGSNGTNYVTDCELGGMPAKACKTADYFTQALPEPQKGPDVLVPLGSTASIKGDPTYTAGSINIPQSYLETYAGTTARELPDAQYNALRFDDRGILPHGGASYELLMVNKNNSSDEHATLRANKDNIYPARYPSTDPQQNLAINPNGSNTIGLAPSNLYTTYPGGTYSVTGGSVGKGTMYADLSDATAATINELRTAFALQKYFEAQAMYGSRYIETLKALFGVTSSDARLQRSEYLGGMRFDINMGQILQTSSTDATSPQGNPAGFSMTNVRDSLFTKSFEEHGILMGLMVIRTAHTYQQGLNKIFSRRKITDFYNPYFAHLGNLPIFNKEIFAQGPDVVDSDTGEIVDDMVFGYQEAWAEYRYIPNRVSGYVRSIAKDHGGSLDIYTYADDYETLPKLDKDWIIEPKTNVDRTLAVQSGVTHQFIADLWIREFATRCMPMFSMPGLIDHV